MGFYKEAYSWVKILLFVLALSLCISVFVIEPYQVSGSSMEPTLEGRDMYNSIRGDKVIVLKSFYLLMEEPKYGDIVVIDSRVERDRTMKDEVFENPIITTILGEQQDYLWIKRVIGTPGDVLESIDGVVYRNGSKLEEEYIKDNQNTSSFETIIVPENHVFVMGDNRSNSSDSRAIGTVPLGNVKGKAVLRYFPPGKL